MTSPLFGGGESVAGERHSHMAMTSPLSSHLVPVPLVSGGPAMAPPPAAPAVAPAVNHLVRMEAAMSQMVGLMARQLERPQPPSQQDIVTPLPPLFHCFTALS